MTVMAHTGHWLVNVLYAAPIVALMVLLIRDRLKHRGAAGEEPAGDPPGDGPDAGRAERQSAE